KLAPIATLAGHGMGGWRSRPPGSHCRPVWVWRSVMLTETVAGRTYDYSHNVGRGAATGMGFANPVALAVDADGVVYVVNRGGESISNVPWDRTGVGARISRVSLGSQSGEEEYLSEFSRYGR